MNLLTKKVNPTSILSVHPRLAFLSNLGGHNMPKKKKEETIEDILDRIEQDITVIREKLWDMEADDKVEDDDDFDDEDEDEDEE